MRWRPDFMSTYHEVNRWIILQHYSELYFGGGGCGEHPSGNNVKLFTGFYSMQTCGYEGYTDAGEDPAPIVVFCGLML